MKYVLAALLALLTTQAVVVPPARVADRMEIVCSSRAEQQAPQEAARLRRRTEIRQGVPVYASWIKPQPDAAVLFERPPPTFSLFA